MPSGPKKRRAAKRKKKEVDKIVAFSVATISKDAIDDSNSSKDANLGDHPVVAASTVVDSPDPEDKSVNDDIKAISSELNVLPSVDTKTSSSTVLHLNEKECFAQTENISFESISDYLVFNDDNPIIYQAAEGEICSKEFEGDLISNQDSASANVFSKNSSEDVVRDVDAPVDILHKSVREGNEDNYLEMNVDATLSSPPTVISNSSEDVVRDVDAPVDILHESVREGNEDNYLEMIDDVTLSSPPTEISKSDKGSPVQEKGDATLTDHMATETREDRLLLNDGALQVSQNPLAGILSHEEIAVEDKNIGHERKTGAVSEQDDSFKITIEELRDATNKLIELQIKLLHILDTIQPMEVA